MFLILFLLLILTSEVEPNRYNKNVNANNYLGNSIIRGLINKFLSDLPPMVNPAIGRSFEYTYMLGPEFLLFQVLYLDNKCYTRTKYFRISN